MTESVERNKPITIYTTSETKEKIDDHFKDTNVVKQPFLSNLITDLVTDIDFFLYVLNYQIQKNQMAMKKHTEEDYEKLTGEEAKRILFINNRINGIYQERFELNKKGESTSELDKENEALKAEKSATLKEAFSREEKAYKGLCFDMYGEKTE